MKERQKLNISHREITDAKEHSMMFFILFPAIAMLLGWGLRGFIGGGPYGAMVPGAMVSVIICMLLDVPARYAGVAIVFGTAGIAMGGEMTYGQTLGFLLRPETIWWGLAGTTLKGGVWGLTGGLFMALGLLYPRIKTKTILTGFLIFLIGFVVGLKLINDPKILYFSNPFDHPRSESWAGILLASAGLFIFMRSKLASRDFKIVSGFSIFGLVGGMLGFGAGSLWMAVGARYGDRFFIIDWWKMMEFSFGLILGGSLGFAAWRFRSSIQSLPRQTQVKSNNKVSLELISVLLIGLFVYSAMPVAENYLVRTGGGKGMFLELSTTIGRVLVSYLFIGLVLIAIALYRPFLSFQIAVTLTVCHCIIDLVEDHKLFPVLQSLSIFSFGIVVVSSLIVAAFVAVFRRKRFVLGSMLLILVWSTMTVAIIRLYYSGDFNFKEGHSLAQIIIGDMFVFNVFMVSAIIVSLVVAKNKIFHRHIPA